MESIQSRRSIQSPTPSAKVKGNGVQKLTFTMESKICPAAVASLAPFEEYIKELTDELVKTSPQARYPTMATW